MGIKLAQFFFIINTSFGNFTPPCIRVAYKFKNSLLKTLYRKKKNLPLNKTQDNKYQFFEQPRNWDLEIEGNRELSQLSFFNSNTNIYMR